jgi:hypothetical protein
MEKKSSSERFHASKSCTGHSATILFDQSLALPPTSFWLVVRNDVAPTQRQKSTIDIHDEQACKWNILNTTILSTNVHIRRQDWWLRRNMWNIRRQDWRLLVVCGTFVDNIGALINLAQPREYHQLAIILLHLNNSFQI